MKALFLKEFRQGRPLLVFAAALAVLIAIGRALIARSDPYYLRNPEELYLGAGWLLLAAPPLLAALAGAGLFAAEADRGTLPVLLALPLSRRRIWLGKALAGAALAVVASAVLLGLARVLIPLAFAVLPYGAFVPDMVLWTTLAFAAALCASAVVGSTTGSLGFGMIVAGAVAAGAACLWIYLGAPLLWNSENLDIALWGAIAAPALLLGSLAAVTRGELLQSGRKWRLAGGAFVVALIASVLLACGLARAGTRYRRSAVTEARVETLNFEPKSFAALPVVALGDPIRTVRVGRKGWRQRESGHDVQNQEPAARYRRNYGVVLDPASGRELVAVRVPASEYEGFTMDCSRDGRYAAVLRWPAGLTWGARPNRPQVLEVFDLKARRRLYCGTPEALVKKRTSGSLMGWVPSGRYVAVTVWYGAGHPTVHLYRPTGREVGRIETVVDSRFQWAPSEDVCYGLSRDGKLHRVAVDDMSDVTVWSPPGRRMADFPWLGGVSPDGKWVTLTVRRPEKRREGNQNRVDDARTETWIVSTDGKESALVWSRAPGERGFHATWSAEGNTLYLLDAAGNLLQWRPGLSAPKATGVKVALNGRRVPQLLAPPGTEQLVVRAVRPKAETWPDSQTVVDGEFLLVDPGGKVTESPASSLAKDYWPRGFDTRGRLILQGNGEILSADLDTGDVRRVYP